MWKTESPYCLGEWEPFELRMLKRKLASLDGNCRCISGVYNYHSNTPNTKESTSNTTYQIDQNVQTVDFIDINPKDPIKVTCDNFTNDTFSSFNICNKNDICSACYFTQNMFKGISTRILKDEEIETKPEMFSCDKSTSKTVQYLEAATSLTFKPVLKSSLLSVVNNENVLDPPQNKGSSHREVTFALQNRSQKAMNFVSVESINPCKPYTHCACARLIESVRPHCTWRTHHCNS